MIFVMCGPYGNKDKYTEMLDKLALKDDDSLFVLGNIYGDGKDGTDILFDMMYRPNIFPILGFAEYSAKTLFPKLLEVKSIDDCVSVLSGEEKEFFGKWIKHGGYCAVETFLSLGAEDKESLIDFLSEFEAFEELEAKGKTFVLASAGIDGFDAEKELDEYDEADFVMHAADYSKIYFPNKFLITASLSADKIPGATAGKVFSAKRHLALGCSAKENGRLCAVCLDTMKVYYC